MQSTQPVQATTILAGTPLREHLCAQVQARLQTWQTQPRLVIVQVGDVPASIAYVQQKLRAAARVGITARLAHLAADREDRLHGLLLQLAGDDTVHGVLLQLPLPDGWQTQAALDLIPARKDVDGLSSENVALRRAGDARALWPATPLGVLRLLGTYDVTLAGTRACVVGRSALVGQPLAELLAQAGAVVTSVGKETPSPWAQAAAAELVCVAAGVPGLIDARWVKRGAIVVDIGITRQVFGDGRTRLVGDVDVAAVRGHVGALTPVPGGVGPLTVASLLTNVVDAFALQTGETRPVWRVRD